MSFDYRKVYANDDLPGMAYPCEYVIRIFKGSYPRLELRNDIQGKRILDIGCGDGRNMLLLREVGMEVHGIEVSEPTVELTRKNLAELGLTETTVAVGENASIPYEDGYFDYLLSWNAGYYMAGGAYTFEQYVAEYARVLKPGGRLVMSVPKPTSFIFDASEDYEPGYQIIRNDPFAGRRNGEIMRCFNDQNDLYSSLSGHFEAFVGGDIHDDSFGYNYHSWMLVATKK